MAIRNPTQLSQALCLLTLAVESDTIRVCLLEPVAGRQRLIAWVSTKRDIHAALNGQIAATCARLGERIERHLWDEQRYQPALNLAGGPHLPGLDLLTAAIDPRPPMRVWLAGISESVSLATAQEAISATPSQIVGETVCDNRLSPEQVAIELARSRAEVLVITGGFDRARATARHGVLDLCTLLDSALDMMDRDHLPLVIYAGSRQANESVRTLLQREDDERRLQIVDNVRPAAQVTMLAGLVQALQDERWRLAQRVSGIAALAHWITPPAQMTTLDWSFARMVQVWSERLGLEELHGVYKASDWRQHVWVRRGHARVRMVYADASTSPSRPEGWPPIQLWSGPTPDDEAVPPRLRWLDRSGMAPLIATVGQVSPAAMFQVLERDIFGER